MAITVSGEKGIATVQSGFAISTESAPGIQDTYGWQVWHSTRQINRKWQFRPYSFWVGCLSFSAPWASQWHVWRKLWLRSCGNLYSFVHLDSSCESPSRRGCRVGSYKLVSHSLRAVWLLSTLSAIVSVCEKSLPLTNTTIHYTQLILVLPQYVLLGAFIATAVPLGIDQIHSASVSSISAFIQWLLWAYFSGIALPGIMGS